MTPELVAEAARARQRMPRTWAVGKPVAIFALAAWASIVVFFLLQAKDPLCGLAVLTAVFGGFAAFLQLLHGVPRRRALRALDDVTSALFGWHDPELGLVFVTPRGVFLEGHRQFVPFTPDNDDLPAVTMLDHDPEHRRLVITLARMPGTLRHALHVPANIDVATALARLEQQHSSARPR